MRSGRQWLVCLLVALSGPVAAADEMQWLDSIDQARQIAGSTQRLVLVHFWSNSCKPCSRLEEEVYRYPGIGTQIGATYVPVKVNVDQHPGVRQQFKVEFVPTDVILAPNGTVIAHRACPLNRFEYIAGLAQVAASYASGTASPYAALAAGRTETASTPAAPPTTGSTAGLANPMRPGSAADPSPAAGATSPAGTVNLGDRYRHLAGSWNQPPAGAGSPMPPAGGSTPAAGAAGAGAPPAAQAQQAGPGYGPPASSPPTAQQTSALLPSQPPMGSGGPATAGAGGAAAAHPPLGLDGTCPVELVDNERWIAGDRRWGAIHRGRLYLFTSQAHQQKFLANPDYYSPAISGHDPVLAVDQRQLVAGKRQHGLFYDKRVFLFANEQTLARFYQDPLRYAEGIRQVGPAAGK